MEDKLRIYVGLAFLVAIGTKKIRHSNRTLFEHLYGTYVFLKQWGCDEDVCRAGFFHSIYGTKIFKKNALPYSKRNLVRLLIGNRSEQLVYYFSLADDLYRMAHSQSPCLTDDEYRLKIPIGAKDLEDLLLIEIANQAEQEGARTFFKDILARLQGARLPASSKVFKILRDLAD